MGEVKRYAAYDGEQDPLSEYVLYDDHAARIAELEAERDRAEAELKMTERERDAAITGYACLRDGVRRLIDTWDTQALAPRGDECTSDLRALLDDEREEPGDGD
jgi:uncharacterized small protein (DUF1192 family)